MQRAATAEKQLHTTAKRYGCTDKGIDWMDHALDPFKDILKPNTGYPDKNSNPSVIEVVKQDISITAPGAVNWDCCIFIDQMLQKVAQYQTLANGSFGGPNSFQLSGQGAVPYQRGGLVWRTDTSGNPLAIATTRGSMEVDPALYANEDCRVIATGFEVHDVTQELKKQGALITWRIDQTTEQPTPIAIVQDAGVTACVPTSANFVRLANPPETPAQALDMVGSQEWEAPKGAYIVPVMNSDTNPAMGLRGDSVSYSADSGGLLYAPLIQSTGAAKLMSLANASPIAQCPNPWSMSGVFITGLDPAAVLKVNFNFIIERFPNRSSSVKRLCYPSPTYDNKALELYSAIAASLPTGVPVGQNGFGDWIWGIARIASSVLSTFPVTQVAGHALGAAVKVRDEIKKEKEKQKEAKIEKVVEQRVEKKLEAKKVAKKVEKQAAQPKPRKQQQNVNSVPFPSMYVPMNPWSTTQPQHYVNYRNPQGMM